MKDELETLSAPNEFSDKNPEMPTIINYTIW